MLPKSNFHHLLDLITGIPKLLERTEDPRWRNRNSSPSSLILVREQSFDIERGLRRWYVEYELRSNVPPFTKRKPPFLFQSIEKEPLGTESQEALSFVDFGVARMHLFYWAALLLVYTNIQELSRLLSKKAREQENLPNPSSIALGLESLQVEPRMQETGMLIIKSMPYFLSADTRILGPQNVFFPLRIAQRAFSQLMGKEEEVVWCKDIFKELKHRGYPFGELLSGTAWDDIPKLLSGN